LVVGAAEPLLQVQWPQVILLLQLAMAETALHRLFRVLLLLMLAAVAEEQVQSKEILKAQEAQVEVVQRLMALRILVVVAQVVLLAALVSSLLR
jgi:hypothetical protein